MTQTIVETGTVLDRIVRQTAVDLESRRSAVPRTRLQELIQSAPPPVDVIGALRKSTITIIAEFKRASPSKGRFPVEIDPVDVATSYIDGGASMMSCLTDGPFFQGNLEDLDQVVATSIASARPVPVLRKDFMIDAYQVDEARAHGASCILLMASVLPLGQLRDLNRYARELGMTSLIEVHDEDELDRAMQCDPHLLGINNRNLKSLTVSLSVFGDLASSVPKGPVLVAESGIHTRADVETMSQSGADAILVGESLIVQQDRGAAVKALAGVEKVGRD